MPVYSNLALNADLVGRLSKKEAKLALKSQLGQGQSWCSLQHAIAKNLVPKGFISKKKTVLDQKMISKDDTQSEGVLIPIYAFFYCAFTSNLDGSDVPLNQVYSDTDPEGRLQIFMPKLPGVLRYTP